MWFKCGNRNGLGVPLHPLKLIDISCNYERLNDLPDIGLVH